MVQHPCDVDALEHVDALSSLTDLVGLDITGNDVLTSIDGVSGITSVSAFLRVQGNDVLTNVDGLVNLTDAIADQAHDKHGVDCLLTEAPPS